MKIRKPAVAGQFYASDKNSISELLEKILKQEQKQIDYSLSGKEIIGGVIPHAGHIFSAYQAVHFFEILRKSKQQFDTFIIINPNHRGTSPEIALDENKAWETPYGTSKIDAEFQSELDLPKSGLSHKWEHSGEVILPYLQHFLEYDFQIVPVSISKQNPENSIFLAQEIFSAQQKTNRKICILASTDFSHFVEPEYGKSQDRHAVKAILQKDEKQLFKAVKKYNISMCGHGPVMTLISYSKLISDTSELKILKQGHSGEVIPSNEVVDYISMACYIK